MKNIVPFIKEIKFDDKIAEVTSISLEEDYSATSDTIDGYFKVFGEYKSHELSVNKEEFSYDLPFSVDLTENIIPDTLKFEVTDFSYDILNDNILKVNIEFMINADVKEENDDFEISSDEIFIEDEKREEPEEVIEVVDDEYTTLYVHIVKENETYESICEDYKIDINILKEYNDLDVIEIGKKLIIPSTNE